MANMENAAGACTMRSQVNQFVYVRVAAIIMKCSFNCPRNLNDAEECFLTRIR